MQERKKIKIKINAKKLAQVIFYAYTTLSRPILNKVVPIIAPLIKKGVMIHP